MLDDEICKLREELNNSILTGQDYNITYRLSTKLDDLIAEYYKIEMERSVQPKRRRLKANIKKKKRHICY